MATHPYFDDQGSVRWLTDFDEALARANKTGKKVLVLVGREACDGCRELVESVIPQPEVSAYLRKHFICLADDCDAITPAIWSLGAMHMSDARVLPFLMLLDTDGVWLAGNSGPVTAEGLLDFLRSVTEPAKDARVGG